MACLIRENLTQRPVLLEPLLLLCAFFDVRYSRMSGSPITPWLGGMSSNEMAVIAVAVGTWTPLWVLLARCLRHLHKQVLRLSLAKRRIIESKMAVIAVAVGTGTLLWASGHCSHGSCGSSQGMLRHEPVSMSGASRMSRSLMWPWLSGMSSKSRWPSSPSQ